MIEIRSLTKTYGGHHAVNDLSFTAPAGKVTGFLGPNGAGKTTTFRCLLGLAEPTAGVALIGGRGYRELEHPRRQVGAVLESTGFHPVGPAATTCASWPPPCSVTPVSLVFDEPANGLDPEDVACVRNVLRVWADEGRTVVVSSHVLAEVAQVVDRVVVIKNGKLVNESGIAALPASRVVVRVDRTEPMVKALQAAETDFEVQADGAISITGRGAAEIGGIAAAAGVTVTELSKRSASESLEAMFLAVTGGEKR